MNKKEFIEKFKMLSEYDLAKTLNENKKNILEQFPLPNKTAPKPLPISDEELNNFVKKIAKNLKYRANSEYMTVNLLDTKNILQKINNRKTKNGVTALTALKERYRRAGYGDMIKNITNFRVVTDEGKKIKGEILNLISPKQNPPLYIARPEENPPFYMAKPEETQTEISIQNKIQYRDCYDFPFEFGCRNLSILKIQSCLGLKQDGYYGPKTNQSLIDKGFNMNEKIITKQIYDTVISRLCGGNEPISPIKTDLKTPAQVNAPSNIQMKKLSTETPQDIYDRLALAKELWYRGDSIVFNGEKQLTPDEIRKLNFYAQNKKRKFVIEKPFPKK